MGAKRVPERSHGLTLRIDISFDSCRLPYLFNYIFRCHGLLFNSTLSLFYDVYHNLQVFRPFSFTFFKEYQSWWYYFVRQSPELAVEIWRYYKGAQRARLPLSPLHPPRRRRCARERRPDNCVTGQQYWRGDGLRRGLSCHVKPTR